MTPKLYKDFTLNIFVNLKVRGLIAVWALQSWCNAVFMFFLLIAIIIQILYNQIYATIQSKASYACE